MDERDFIPQDEFDRADRVFIHLLPKQDILVGISADNKDIHRKLTLAFPLITDHLKMLQPCRIMVVSYVENMCTLHIVQNIEPTITRKLKKKWLNDFCEALRASTKASGLLVLLDDDRFGHGRMSYYEDLSEFAESVIDLILISYVSESNIKK
jgi:hypothetical protein